jgi:hypothetical protein
MTACIGRRDFITLLGGAVADGVTEKISGQKTRAEILQSTGYGARSQPQVRGPTRVCIPTPA